MRLPKTLSLVAVFSIGALAGPAPKGKPVEPSGDEAALLSGLQGKAKGKIVWSTSRDGNHDIYIMNADGSDPKPLTKGPKTDWYSRISPDGKRVIFTRSKLDWTNEMAANYPERWDTWIINIDGTGERLLAKNSTWATWSSDGQKVIFSRGTDVYECDAEGQNEKKIVDGAKSLKGGIAQSPHLSDDGRFLALTLRGKQRETGILDLEKGTWFKSVGGGGCQLNFFPKSHRVLWVHPTGKGGTQIFSTELKDGKHGDIKGEAIEGKSVKLIDLPYRNSHEYFPQISTDGQWMSWAATARGHDHDIADYEIFVWKVGDAADKAVRVTFHSGNDRWPDMWME